MSCRSGRTPQLTSVQLNQAWVIWVTQWTYPVLMEGAWDRCIPPCACMFCGFAHTHTRIKAAGDTAAEEPGPASRTRCIGKAASISEPGQGTSPCQLRELCLPWYPHTSIQNAPLHGFSGAEASPCYRPPSKHRQSYSRTSTFLSSRVLAVAAAACESETASAQWTKRPVLGPVSCFWTAQALGIQTPREAGPKPALAHSCVFEAHSLRAIAQVGKEGERHLPPIPREARVPSPWVWAGLCLL